MLFQRKKIFLIAEAAAFLVFSAAKAVAFGIFLVTEAVASFVFWPMGLSDFENGDEESTCSLTSFFSGNIGVINFFDWLFFLVWAAINDDIVFFFYLIQKLVYFL